MKKFLLVFAIISIFIFSGCSENIQEKPKINLPISLTVKLSQTDIQFQAQITETEYIITFDENHPLFGTELRFNQDGKGKATIGDFSREIELYVFPAQKALLKAIKHIYQNPDSGTKTEKGYMYTIDEMTIMVYYDKDFDAIIGIGTEENGRTFDFEILSVMPI